MASRKMSPATDDPPAASTTPAQPAHASFVYHGPAPTTASDETAAAGFAVVGYADSWPLIAAAGMATSAMRPARERVDENLFMIRSFS